MSPKTMFEKIWERHTVVQDEGQPTLLYVDLHLIHEVSSPQAFEGLRLAERSVRRPELTVATMDHNVPTRHEEGIGDSIAVKQMEALKQNCREQGILLFDLYSSRQGIVHVIGPELGLTLPGQTIVCGDSHTSTHGAFGALAFGIGTSEVEEVLATQCLWQEKPKTMEVHIHGVLSKEVTAKDVSLTVIKTIGTDGGVGHVIEYTGEVVRAMSMEERMTICNMSIEAGARAGMVAPDKTTFEYVKGRRYAPGGPDFTKAIRDWEQLSSDPEAVYDRRVEIEADTIVPQVTWGTTPGMVCDVTGVVPDPDMFEKDQSRNAGLRALNYMGLTPGTRITAIPVDRVFIGSCTNSRIEDLRAAARIVKGYKVSSSVRAMVVPGSQQVKKQAENEGLDQVFKESGFDWRNSGCSMCVAMNADTLQPGERCASTSNRNFEGRQGRGGRTHLVSPAMAAAAAIAGHFVDVRNWSSHA